MGAHRHKLRAMAAERPERSLAGARHIGDVCRSACWAARAPDHSRRCSERLPWPSARSLRPGGTSRTSDDRHMATRDAAARLATVSGMVWEHHGAREAQLPPHDDPVIIRRERLCVWQALCVHGEMQSFRGTANSMCRCSGRVCGPKTIRITGKGQVFSSHDSISWRPRGLLYLTLESLCRETPIRSFVL